MKIPLRTFPLSTGLLDPRHVKAIGRAVWVYLWFLNRVTKDEQRAVDDFVGIVLNGRPLSIDEIAEELGFDYYACRRDLARLVRAGYIERRKTGAGMFSYGVTKSKRWAWRRQTVGAEASSPREKQANLFSQTEASTEQKVLSGSEHPQSKIWSQGGDPQTRKCNSTDQKLVCAQRGTRARSQESQESHKERGRSRDTLSELPTDFAPKDSHRELARELNLNLERTFRKFCDHHASKGTKFKDWDRAFSAWLRRELDFARSAGPNCVAAFRPTPSPPAWSDEVKRMRRAAGIQ
jgi:hypothetical protein